MFTLRQWAILATGLAEIGTMTREAWPHIKPVWPHLKPIIDRGMRLAKDLDLDFETQPQAPTIKPKDLIERSHGLNVDEQRIFDRHGPE